MRHTVMIALIAFATGCSAPPPSSPDHFEAHATEPPHVVDLTHVLSTEIPYYPGGTPLTVENKAALERDGYYMNTIHVGEHTGTHVDAPSHFIAAGASVDRIPVNDLVGPGAVIDISGKCAANADYQLSYIDIKQWEAEHGRIPNGAILLINTGWAKRWPDPGAYRHADADGVMHFPGVSPEAAQYLAKYRDVAGVGIDTLSIDFGASTSFAAHKTLHADGAFHIENVANLDHVPPRGATIVVAPLPIRDGSGAPCRVFALVSNGPSGKLGAGGGQRGSLPYRKKYLIEFGWDIPSQRTLADAANAGTPFDGAVFDVEVKGSDGALTRFSWLTFGPAAMNADDVARIVHELKATPAGFRRHSFIRFNVTPGEIDWFDDWSGILANARSAARIVREARLAGLLLDVEQYQGRIFDYRERPGKRTFEEHERQARLRGAEFIQTVNGACRRLDILLTFGYALADRRRAQAEYGLLPAFLDGMITARGRETQVIDGYEFAYPFKSRAAFQHGRQEILRESNGRCGVGFGIWLDWNSGTRGWNANDPKNNWFSPDQFGAAVRHALEAADRYVWIYSERLNWWTRENLPEPYVQTLRQARRDGDR